MPRGSQKLVQAKVDYVKELVGANKAMLMYGVQQEVQHKFGETLAPDKLRAAFLQAGGTIGKRGGRRKAEAETLVDVKPVLAAKTTKRKPGRRRADKVAAQSVRVLTELGKHIVVVRTEDVPEVHEFASQDEAKSFLSGQLSDGVPASALGFYVREPLQLSIGI